MITSKMLGSFRSDARTRNEFLTFIDIRDRRRGDFETRRRRDKR